MYLVYILRCVDNTLYTGITNNLERRMKVHSSGKGAKYVKARLPFKMVYCEEVGDKSSALKRERFIKKLCKKDKENLVHNFYFKK